ncbi:MAG: tetratricopeptide repeat protein [Proteobacteria bacterium]|jgi:predicted ATPase/Tfp pilus assembly protein PilF|nr:tetratricopeptide repeat protein [Pseudomonadota bacterium]
MIPSLEKNETQLGILLLVRLTQGLPWLKRHVEELPISLKKPVINWIGSHTDPCPSHEPDRFIWKIVQAEIDGRWEECLTSSQDDPLARAIVSWHLAMEQLEQGRVAEADQTLEQAQFPDDGFQVSRVLLLVFRAKQTSTSGAYGAALEITNQALTIAREEGANLEALVLDIRGEIQAQLGDLERAVKDWSTALRIRNRIPREARLIAHKLGTTFLRLARPQEALAVAETYLTGAEGALISGQALADQGAYRAARQRYRRAAQLNVDLPHLAAADSRAATVLGEESDLSDDDDLDFTLARCATELPSPNDSVRELRLNALTGGNIDLAAIAVGLEVRLAMGTGDSARASLLLEVANRLVERHSDKRRRQRTLRQKAIFTVRYGDPAHAVPMLRQLVSSATDAHDLYGEAAARMWLARALLHQSRTQALDESTKAVSIAEEHGFVWLLPEAQAVALALGALYDSTALYRHCDPEIAAMSFVGLVSRCEVGEGKWRLLLKAEDAISHIPGDNGSAVRSMLESCLRKEGICCVKEGNRPSLVLVMDKREVWHAGQKIACFGRAKTSFLLFCQIAIHGSSLSREELFEAAWQVPFRRSSDNTLYVSATRLRERLANTGIDVVAHRDGSYQIANEPAVFQYGLTPKPAIATAPPPLAKIREIDTSFVGRSACLQAIESTLNQGIRCVTLTGPGGIGKTRLALELGHRSKEEVLFCDLSETTTTAGIVRVVASELGLMLQNQDQAIHQVGDVFRARQDLTVILDNLEQTIEPARAVVAQWLHQTSKTRFIATSRELLGLDEERVHEVLSLASADGLHLFLDRQREVRPHFEPTEDQLSTIETLVELLDGIPLAIELAAARMDVLNPKQILDALNSQGLNVLADPLQRPSRQETLRRAINWSWELLDEAEKEAAAQCAVFAGGFLYEAFTGIVRVDDMDDLGQADLLRSLRRKSLLFSRETQSGPRFHLYRPIFAFLNEVFTKSPIKEETQERHGKHYLGLAESLSRSVNGPDCALSLRRLGDELDNLRLAKTDTTGTARIALALDVFFEAHGPPETHIEVLSQALANPPQPLSPRLFAARSRAHLLAGDLAHAESDIQAGLALSPSSHELQCAQADLHRQQGRIDEAKHLCLQVVKSANTALRGNALNVLGATLVDAGSPKEASKYLKEALTLHQRLGALRPMGFTLGQLATVHHLAGDLAAAEEHYNRALDVFGEIDDRRRQARTLGHLSSLARERGDIDLALTRLQRAGKIARETGYARLEAGFLDNMGNLLAQQGRLDEAERYYRQTLDVLRRMGQLRAQGIVLGHLAFVPWARGNPAEAQQLLEEALAINRQCQSKRFEGQALINLGHLALSQFQCKEADVHLTAAISLLRQVGDKRMLGQAMTRYGASLAIQGNITASESTFAEAQRLHESWSSLDSAYLTLAALLDVAKGRAGIDAEGLAKAARHLKQVEESGTYLDKFLARLLADALE